MNFNRLDFIEAGNDSAMLPTVFRGSEEVSDPAAGYISHLDPRYANKPLDLHVAYEDINGQRRESVVRMGKGGIKLLRHGKVS